MLVDLEWTLDHAHVRERTEWIKEFNTEGGSLVITVEFPPDVKGAPRIWRRTVAERVHKGVYWSWDMWNSIEFYTNWSVEHPWDEQKRVFDAMCEARKRGDEEEHERLRERFRRFQSEYGNVDNLKQVFRRGHTFIQSPHPYVLEIRQVDVSGPDGDRYFSKNGGYHGAKKIAEVNEVLHYSFHKLTDKKPCRVSRTNTDNSKTDSDETPVSTPILVSG